MNAIQLRRRTCWVGSHPALNAECDPLVLFKNANINVVLKFVEFCLYDGSCRQTPSCVVHRGKRCLVCLCTRTRWPFRCPRWSLLFPRWNECEVAPLSLALLCLALSCLSAARHSPHFKADFHVRTSVLTDIILSVLLCLEREGKPPSPTRFSSCLFMMRHTITRSRDFYSYEATSDI